MIKYKTRTATRSKKLK